MGNPLPISPMTYVANADIYAPPGIDHKGLPEPGIDWPMRPFDEAQKQMGLWNAWYSSNLEEIELRYVQKNNAQAGVGNLGWMGRIQRFFWGRPNQQSTPRIHVPVPADLSRASSDLLFAEPLTITLDQDEKPTSKDKAAARLETVFGGDDTVVTLSEAGELCSALGGVYLRLWWDQDISDHVMLGQVAADAAIPEWRYDRLAAVTFWTIVAREDNTWVRHLERHEPGRIIHGLYEGDAGTLGSRIPLTESPATAWAATLGNNSGIITTGVKGLTAGYVPNVRPNRSWRNKPGLAPLGRSDYDGLEGLFDSLDEAYSSWMRDIDLGRARIFIDENLLQSQGPGQGKLFDTEQSVFTRTSGVLKSSANDTGMGIMANQFNIRWMEHAQTVAELLNCILRAAGMSTGSFSDTALTVGVPTATEIHSRDNLSERTRAKKVNYWKASLRPLSFTAMQLDSQVFRTGINLEMPPSITFPTRSMQSPQEMSQTLAALRAAEMISLKQGIIDYRPNWTMDQVNAELAMITAEQAQRATVNVTPNADDDNDDSDTPGGSDTPDGNGGNDFGQDDGNIPSFPALNINDPTAVG